VSLPIHDTQKLTGCFRRRVIALFLRKNLITESFSEMLLRWRHSGFSVNNSVRMAGDDHKARVSLAQSIARAPLSLEQLSHDELDGKALYHSADNPYLGENLKVWDALDFLALATSFIPPQGVRLIRYFGLYSSRSRWKWPLWQHVAAHAPLGWKCTHEQDNTNPKPEPPRRTLPECASRSAWARLIAQVYEVNLIGGSCLRSKQREPSGLSSLHLRNASAGRHHQCRRGEENPAPPDQDRLPSSGLGSLAAELIVQSIDLTVGRWTGKP
jgi:hypothetical protein